MSMITTMTIREEHDEPESLYDHSDDHILDWLQDTVPFLPSFFDDPNYTTTTITNPTNIVSDITEEFQWWDDQDLIVDPNLDLINPTPTTPTTPTTTTTTTTANLLPPSLSKKRKPSDVNLQVNNQRRRSVGPTKKSTVKSAGNNYYNCNNSKDGRWAEQLLLPCGVAICAGNLTRVQHLLYVLHELASSSGDANHRLANYGLRALTHHLSSSTTTVGPTSSIFASTEPRLFQRSLLKFYEVSPWFTFANTISNSSILQVLAQQSKSSSKTLHILDIGVSHGIQWPTLLEALSRRSNGPTPVVRITVINSSTSDCSHTVSPFSIGPPGDDYATRLRRFAKSINIDLEIEQLNTHPLQILTPEMINTSPSETLIVCTQFRLHNLNHNTPNDERTKFLQFLTKLKPSAVILSENDVACSCTQCGNFSIRFTRKVEYLWRFLESTSCAFKGRDCEERKVFEGEASKVIMSEMEMNDGREKWCEKMGEVGFVSEGFGEDVIDGGKSLLRKYDSNWEMKVDEKDGCACLLWKGERVSFCSLWKLN